MWTWRGKENKKKKEIWTKRGEKSASPRPSKPSVRPHPHKPGRSHYYGCLALIQHICSHIHDRSVRHFLASPSFFFLARFSFFFSRFFRAFFSLYLHFLVFFSPFLAPSRLFALFFLAVSRIFAFFLDAYRCFSRFFAVRSCVAVLHDKRRLRNWEKWRRIKIDATDPERKRKRGDKGQINSHYRGNVNAKVHQRNWQRSSNVRSRY